MLLVLLLLEQQAAVCGVAAWWATARRMLDDRDAAQRRIPLIAAQGDASGLDEVVHGSVAPVDDADVHAACREERRDNSCNARIILGDAL